MAILWKEWLTTVKPFFRPFYVNFAKKFFSDIFIFEQIVTKADKIFLIFVVIVPILEAVNQ